MRVTGYVPQVVGLSTHSAVMRSKFEPESKFDNSRVSGACHLSKVRDSESRGHVRKVSVIEDVVEVGPELDLLALCNSEIFVQRYVKVDCTRANNGPRPSGPKESRRRRSKRVRVEPFVLCFWTRDGDSRNPVRASSQSRVGGAQPRIHWKATLNRCNVPDLPASKHRALKSLCGTKPRQSPYGAKCKHMEWSRKRRPPIIIRMIEILHPTITRSSLGVSGSSKTLLPGERPRDKKAMAERVLNVEFKRIPVDRRWAYHVG